jgi:hypothetical protein
LVKKIINEEIKTKKQPIEAKAWLVDWSDEPLPKVFGYTSSLMKINDKFSNSL